jgi:hypothetical protein
MNSPHRARRFTWLPACACTAALLWPGAVEVRAQAAPQEGAPAPSPLAVSLGGQAKVDYEAGRILVADKDFAGALVKFQQAFVQSGDRRLLWNMAVCEKNLRHYGNVLGLLERYQREGDAGMSDAHRKEVKDVVDTVKTLISNVQIAVNEAGASVFVDDRLMGQTPLDAPLRIDLGKRKIRVAKPGFSDQSVVQEFAGGSTVTFSFTLKPKPSEARLTISSDEASMINIDGAAMGERYWQGSVLAGEHRIRVTAPGMQPYTKEMVLVAGQSRTLHISLVREKSGVPAYVWVGAGVLAAGGLATGAYFLFGNSGERPAPDIGTLPPGYVRLP